MTEWTARSHTQEPSPILLGRDCHPGVSPSVSRHRQKLASGLVPTLTCTPGRKTYPGRRGRQHPVFMSPQDDVNRWKTLARSEKPAQQNIGLDRNFLGPNPESVSEVHDRSPTDVLEPNKKSAPKRAFLSIR